MDDETIVHDAFVLYLPVISSNLKCSTRYLFSHSMLSVDCRVLSTKPEIGKKVNRTEGNRFYCMPTIMWGK